MSTKNQKTLVIFASLIIVLTAVVIISLNIIVNKISHISGPRFIMDMPGQKPPIMGTDDSLKNGPPPGMMPQAIHPNPGQKDGMGRGFDNAQNTMPFDMQKRVRNGKNMPDLKRMPPDQKRPGPPPGFAGPGFDDSLRKPPPPPPQNMPNKAPPYNNQGAPKEEKQRALDEMEQRRQMYYKNQPPDYYPPPPPPDDYYDNPYDGPEDYYYDDYYYDQDYEGKNDHNSNDKPSTQAKVSDAHEEREEDIENAHLENLDEYLWEALEEE
jgi:hypothetical protein